MTLNGLPVPHLLFTETPYQMRRFESMNIFRAWRFRMRVGIFDHVASLWKSG